MLTRDQQVRLTNAVIDYLATTVDYTFTRVDRAGTPCWRGSIVVRGENGIPPAGDTATIPVLDYDFPVLADHNVDYHYQQFSAQIAEVREFLAMVRSAADGRRIETRAEQVNRKVDAAPDEVALVFQQFISDHGDAAALPPYLREVADRLIDTDRIEHRRALDKAA